MTTPIGRLAPSSQIKVSVRSDNLDSLCQRREAPLQTLEFLNVSLVFLDKEIVTERRLRLESDVGATFYERFCLGLASLPE
jgi:hypothetical protein